MNYSSTRGNSEQVTSAEAIIKGLASDEGLFVPDSLPPIDEDFIESLVPLTYEERAAKVLGLFLTDYSPAEIQDCVTKAYGQGKFDCQAKAPVTDLGDMQVLELWHGPTSAFKDMALQLLDTADATLGIEYHDGNLRYVLKTFQRRFAGITGRGYKNQHLGFFPGLLEGRTHQLRQQLQSHILESARR
ncbi:MAG: hypothetical protein IIT82_10045, partial [Selenomonas sp.]|nr:hypothetical protein [Selenomonas sp.]